MTEGIITIRTNRNPAHEAEGAQFYVDDLTAMTPEGLWKKYQEALVAIKKIQDNG